MNAIAAVLADEDFQNGAAVIGIVAVGALLILASGKLLDRWLTSEKRGPADTVNAAGIDIVAEQGDYIPDLRKPHYPNGCGCVDCTNQANAAAYAPQPLSSRKPLPYRPRWKPTDAEIEQFLTEAQNGGTQ